MNTRRLVVPIWLILVLGIAIAAEGQQRQYQPPSRPALSPYLDYFRADVGLLDRRNAIVAPDIRTQQNFQQLQSRISDQRSQLNSLQGQVEQIRDPKMRRTGTASAFMNYSHYYRLTPPARSPSR